MAVKKELKQFPYVDGIEALKHTAEAAGGFLSVEQAAKMLHTTKSQLVALEGRGEISGYRVRSSYATSSGESDPSKDNIFIAQESVKAYAERKRQKSAAAASKN